MVTTYPTIRNQVTEHAREISELDDVRTSWVAAYRQKHAEGDWWAAGFGIPRNARACLSGGRTVGQSGHRPPRRIRCATPCRRSCPGQQRKASRRRALQTRHLYLQGRAVRSDDYPRDPWSSRLFAAAVGCGVIDTLLGPHGVVVNLLPPEAFEEQLEQSGQRWLPEPQEGRAIILLDRAPRLDRLRSMGFDPITFDGIDPAAFAWAIFELASRAEDAAAQLRCDCHPSFRPVPLGVAVDGSSPSLMFGERLPMMRLVPARA